MYWMIVCSINHWYLRVIWCIFFGRLLLNISSQVKFLDTFKMTFFRIASSNDRSSHTFHSLFCSNWNDQQKMCVFFFPFAINVYWVIEGDTPHWEFFPHSHFAPWDHIESSVFSFDWFFIWSRDILFATNAFPYFSTLEISFAITPNRSNHQIMAFCFCF